MTRFAQGLVALALAACAAGGPTGAAAAARTSSFDGTWSVSIATTSGACDRSFRFPIQIRNGRVLAEGLTGVYGRVTPGGSVRVTIRQGDRSASGTGRLAGTTGAGRWLGRSPSGRCVGTWQAQRS